MSCGDGIVYPHLAERAAVDSGVGPVAVEIRPTVSVEEPVVDGEAAVVAAAADLRAADTEKVQNAPAMLDSEACPGDVTEQ